ncbi:MAG: ABC transporter ATP-binding protein [Rhizobiaceae bacterium]
MKPRVSGVPVTFSQVEKSFGSVQALEPVSLEIRAGEFLTLLGPSGSGKTTLLNIAAGFLSPDAGHVLLDGRNITNTPPRQRNIGMVFQNYALFPHLDVFENVAYGLRVRKVFDTDLKARVANALAMLQLDGFARRGINQLSGGQQQRVALARAMVIEPSLLLMDEPLGALDRQLRKHVQLEIRRLHVNSPRTTIYVTHDQEEALVMSDRVAIMSKGRIEQIGTPHELYADPKNVFVAQFLGESNILPVTVLRAEDGRAAISLDGVEGRWSVKVSDNSPSGMGSLLVRPESIRPARDGEASVPATVKEVAYLGELSATRLTLPSGKDIWMRSMGPMPAGIGDIIPVRWNEDETRLFAGAASSGGG